MPYFVQGILKPVSIVKYLFDLETLGGLSEAHHVIRAADLDEGEVGGTGQLCGQGSLTSVRRPLEQDGDQAWAVLGGGLLGQQLSVIQDTLSSLSR